MTRLVAIDVDGTLLDGRGRVTGRTGAALAAAVARGVRIAVVTGRNYPFALQAVETLPDPLTVIACNGAVARERHGATLFVHHLDPALARRLLVATRDWRPSTLVQFNRDDRGQTVVDRMSWEPPNRRGYYARIAHLVQQVDDLEQALDGEPPVQVAFNGACDEMRVLLGVLTGLGLDGVAIEVTTYPARDFTLVDVNDARATKGQALAELATRLGVNRDEVFAIGDNHNDIGMLTWAGTGVVMGNCEPELRALGLPITGRNDDDGLAQALERYVL